MSWRLYQSLVEPVQVDTAAEVVTVDKWYQGFTSPIRSAGLAVALIASGAVISPWALTQAEAVTADRWVQPFSTPQSARGLAAGQQQATAFVAVAETVTVDKWFVPLAEQRRARPALTTGDQEDFFVGLPPTDVSWLRPLAEPVRVTVRLGTAAQGATAYVEAAPFAETVSLDRWHVSLSEPVRRKLAPAQQATAFVFAPASTETVTADKWFNPLSEPVRFRRALPIVEQQSLAFVKASLFPETPQVDKWFAPFSETVVKKKTLATSEHPFLAFVKASPFPETVSADRWLVPLAQPTRKPPVQQSSIAAPVTVAETVTADKWLYPLSEPVRVKRTVVHHATLALVEAAPFAEQVTLDRWHLGLSEPIRRKALATPAQQAAAFVYAPAVVAESITPDKWFVPFGEPVRLRWLPSSLWQFSFSDTSESVVTTKAGGGIHLVRRLGRHRQNQETEEEHRARVYAAMDEQEGIKPAPEVSPPIVQPSPAAEVSRKYIKFDDAPWRAMLAEAERRGQEQFGENVEQRLSDAAGLLADTAAQRRRNEEDALAVILMAVLA